MNLTLEVAWHSPEDWMNYPPLPAMDWPASGEGPFIQGTRVPVTEATYLACGYRKMQRYITPWEEVKD